MAASKKDVAKQQVKEDREKVREMYLSGKRHCDTGNGMSYRPLSSFRECSANIKCCRNHENY